MSTTSSIPIPKAEMAPVTRSNRPSIVGPEQPEDPYPMLLEGIVTKGFGRGARFLGIPTANLPDSSLGQLNELQMTGIYYGFAKVHPSISTPLPSTFPSPSVSGTSTPIPNHPSSSSATSTTTPSLLHSQQKRGGILSGEDIASIPASTAPYPPDSIEGEEIKAPKRLKEEDGKVWPMVMSVGWNPYFKNEKITAEVHIIHPFAHDFYGHDMSVLVLGYIRPELDYISKEALIDDINFDVKVALNSLARPGYSIFATDKRLNSAKLGHTPRLNG